MTETQQSPPPDNPPNAPTSSRKPLRRSRDDRIVGGVSAGFAEYLGIDPVLVRVVIVVLSIFGGGILVYLAAWVLIPEEGSDESAVQKLLGGANTPTTVVVVVAVAIGLVIVLATSGSWFGVGPDVGKPGFLLLLATVVLVVWLVRRDRPTDPPNPGTNPPPAYQPAPVGTPGSSPTPEDTAAFAGSVAPAAAPTLVIPSKQPKERRPRSVLGLLTVSVAALVAGSLLVVALSVTSSGIAATTVLASALAVVGVGLLVGTVVGRSRGLIWLGVVLVVVTAASAALSDVSVSGGIGQRTWQPTSATELSDSYRLGIGNATLDLRRLNLSTGTPSAPIRASVGIGELTVYLPRNSVVHLNGSVSAGQIEFPNKPAVSGTEQDLSSGVIVGKGGPTVTLDLKVGLGSVRVQDRFLAPVATPIPTKGALQ